MPPTTFQTVKWPRKCSILQSYLPLRGRHGCQNDEHFIGMRLETLNSDWPNEARLHGIMGCFSLMIESPLFKWGGTGVSETPASRTFYSRFLPPSVGVPASLLCVDGKMLRNIAKFFFFSPGFPPLWESCFPPFLLPPPVPLPPLFSRAPAPLSPPHI